MRFDTIVGYVYRADILCPTCVVEAMISQGIASPAARDMSEEDVLDQCADAMAIYRMDEGSFDSSEFPKVGFACDFGSAEESMCGSCGEIIG